MIFFRFTFIETDSKPVIFFVKIKIFKEFELQEFSYLMRIKRIKICFKEIRRCMV